MTLVAAFRCQQGGILLCADREENDGYAKREVDKIYRIGEFVPCQVFIAGSGPGNIIRLANEEIHESMKSSAKNGENVFVEHRSIIEQALNAIYVKFAKILKLEPMNLIVVVAPRDSGINPLLYQTDTSVLIPESFYVAHGSGKIVADYLSDRLYRPYQNGRLDKGMIGLVAAFILREAEHSGIGVGMGFDMVFIHENNKSLHFIPPKYVEEIQAGASSLETAVHGYWKDHVTIPEWLAKTTLA